MNVENKKIARNTIILYARLVITTLIGLVSSRFVLQVLGASDYGLYNVVGAIIVMFSFLTASLNATTTRFINYEQGKENGDVNVVFNKSLIIHALFSVLTFVILESLGVFYISNFLNVDIGKEGDAMFVFQVSTIISCLSIITIPYQSLFIVNEDFATLAIIDIVGAFVKLLLVIFLFCYQGNALRFYSAGMAFVMLSIMLLSVYVSKRKWPMVTKRKIVGDICSYKEMLSFNNYSLLSAASLIIRNQGSNILINFFFGTVVNAAYAIAFTVQNYIVTFVGNFDSASAPQITQNIGRGEMNRTIFLTTNTCRICVLLTELLLFPILIELDFILGLWLGDNIPDGTILFCKCTLLVALVSATSGGLTQLISGTGRIKWFSLQYTFLYVLALFFGYVLFKLGYPPYVIILLYAIADVLSRINQLFLLKKIIDFDVINFLRTAYVRPCFVLVSGLVYYVICEHVKFNSAISHCLNLGLSTLFLIAMVLIFGLSCEEKKVIVKSLKKLIL